MTQDTDHKRRRLSGVVTSDRMKDTVTVRVLRTVKHPQYGKYVTQQKKYAVDDPGNTHAVGDKVMIEETKPMSKRKRFRVLSSHSDAVKTDGK